jgi:hypothetical protein
MAAVPGNVTLASGLLYSPELNPQHMPSRPGEFHPEPLTDPDMKLSPHPARATPRKPCRASAKTGVPPVAR